NNPSTGYLENEVDFPQLAITQYTNMHDANDHSLSVNDWVRSLPGNNGGVNDTSDPRLDALVGQKIVIPVWDTWDGVDDYHIVTFIEVRLILKEKDGGIDLTSTDPVIQAVYLGPAENCNKAK